MQTLTRLGIVAVTALATTAALAPTVSAADHHGAAHAVFVQTDGPRATGRRLRPSGRRALTASGRYATGGLGGELTGSVVDHLASEGSLAYSPATAALRRQRRQQHRLGLLGAGDRLDARQVVGSGGTFPVSIAVRGHLVYVVNALGGGSVQGFVSTSATPPRPAGTVPSASTPRHAAVRQHARPGGLLARTGAS